MSGLAKLFVIVNAVLCITFFGTSSTLFLNRQQWHAKYEQYRQESEDQLKELRGRIASLNKVKDDAVVALRTVRRNEAEVARQLKEEKLRTTEERAGRERAENRAEQFSQEKTTALNTLAKNDERIQQLTQSLEEAHAARDEAVEKMKVAIGETDRMKRDLASVQRDLHDTRKEYNSLSQETASAQLQLKAYRTQYGDIGSPLPSIDAYVDAVDENLVVLSVGSEDQVKEGFEFSVYRGDEFLGKVRVTKVFAEYSGAELVYTKNGAQIREGDRAATRLN